MQPLARFRSLLELEEKAENTIAAYESTVSLYLATIEGEDPSLKTVQNFLLKKQEEGVKSSTIGRYIAALKCYFDTLGRKAELSPIKAPRIIQEDEETNWLSEEEWELFYAAITTKKWKAIYGLMYYCALRVGEAAKAKITDVKGIVKDPNTGTWLVSPDTPGIFKVRKESDKVKKGGRLPITVRVRENICAYLNTRSDDREWLFLGKKEYITESAISKNAEKILVAHDLSVTGTHWIRHTRITHLANTDYPFAKVSKLARHSNPRMTMRYFHTDPETDFRDLPESDL